MSFHCYNDHLCLPACLICTTIVHYWTFEQQASSVLPFELDGFVPRLQPQRKADCYRRTGQSSCHQSSQCAHRQMSRCAHFTQQSRHPQRCTQIRVSKLLRENERASSVCMSVCLCMPLCMPLHACVRSACLSACVFVSLAHCLLYCL